MEEKEKTEKENKIIDFVISKLNIVNFKEIKKNDVDDFMVLENQKELDDIINIAEFKYKLIDRKIPNTTRGRHNHKMILTDIGDKVNDYGGWIKHLANLESEEQKKTDRESKKDEILGLDIELKKFETKIGHKILIAGAIITVLSFLLSFATVLFFRNE